eukprot:Platyproteum_vivax@DN7555_c0_g2_i1.p2
MSEADIQGLEGPLEMALGEDMASAQRRFVQDGGVSVDSTVSTDHIPKRYASEEVQTTSRIRTRGDVEFDVIDPYAVRSRDDGIDEAVTAIYVDHDDLGKGDSYRLVSRSQVNDEGDVKNYRLVRVVKHGQVVQERLVEEKEFLNKYGGHEGGHDGRTPHERYPAYHEKREQRRNIHAPNEKEHYFREKPEKTWGGGHERQYAHQRDRSYAHEKPNWSYGGHEKPDRSYGHQKPSYGGHQRQNRSFGHNKDEAYEKPRGKLRGKN